MKILFLKWANPGLFFVYFQYFLDTISIIQIEKSVDGALGIRIQGRRMVGADETTELWRPPYEDSLRDKFKKKGEEASTFDSGRWYLSSPPLLGNILS